MPSIQLNYHKAHESLTAPNDSTTKYSTTISTALGLMLLEIQGELNLPTDKPDGLTPDEEALFIETKIPDTVSDTEEIMKNAVKFGKLELDDDGKRATLFISKSQRLVGSIEKIDPPLGVLKVARQPADADANANADGAYSQECQIVDVIRQKVVFKLRPLPIM